MKRSLQELSSVPIMKRGAYMRLRLRLRLHPKTLLIETEPEVLLKKD